MAKAIAKSRPSEAAKSVRGRNRREKILTEAAKLFRRDGFYATGVDDIGAAVGITGPGVYRHFASKQDLLAAILERSIGRHQEILDAVSAADLAPREALEKLVRMSAASLAHNRDDAGIYLQEARNLRPADLQRFARIQRHLIAEWVRVVCATRSELTEEEARVAVRASGGLLNSVAYFTTGMGAERLGDLLADMAFAGLMNAPAGR
jgi:AcrR family transcriptional regulator